MVRNDAQAFHNLSTMHRSGP